MENLIRTYFRPYKKAVAAIVILTAIQVILQILIIDLIKPIISMGINTADTNTIVSYGVVMIALVAGYSVSAVTVARLSARTSAKAVGKIREALFTKILSFKRPRDSGANISGLMTRLIADVNTVQRFMTEFLSIGLYAPLLALAIIVNSFLLNVTLGFVMTSAFIAMIAVVYAMSKNELRVRSKLQRIMERTVHLFREQIRGVRVTRAFGRTQVQYDRFTEESRKYGTLATDTAVRTSYMVSFITLMVSSLILILYWACTIGQEEVEFSIPELVMFFQFVVLFITCASISPFIIITLPEVTVSYRRIEKVMRSESETEGADVPDAGGVPVIETSSGLKVIGGMETSIVGGTGSGKSEVIRALLRLDDAEPGTVMFNGADLMTLDPGQLRGRIAYAGDLALIYRGTVRNNIGAWRDIPEERIEKAMKAADISLPPDFHIDKFGSNISDGQKRKISIARALATDADVYIFDDCFSETDPITENRIVSNIRGMLKGKTVLFSSHEFRIAPDSDMIAVMEGGRIVASGTHDELMESSPLYRSMYMLECGFID